MVGLERAWTRSRSAAGPAPRWPRSSSRACAGETVLCPSNTFMATPLAALRAGAPRRVRRLQPRRPLPVVRRPRGEGRRATGPRAVILVHIGGHIAFDVERIAALCRERGDLPASRTARTRTARRGTAAAPGPGATPASGRSTRRRRSRRARAACSSRATPSCSSPRARSATTASPTTRSPGLNFRMSEFTAALGLVQTERLEEIVAWKNDGRPRAPRPACTRGRLELPDGMVSGPLQVHRLRPGRALDRQGLRPAVPPDHGAPRRAAERPTGSPSNHWCVPLYYRPGG